MYGEKPACYNIYEGMRVIQVQRETKRIMQVGSQHRNWPFKVEAMAALQQGLVGKLYMTKASLETHYRRPDGNKMKTPVSRSRGY